MGKVFYEYSEKGKESESNFTNLYCRLRKYAIEYIASEREILSEIDLNVGRDVLLNALDHLEVGLDKEQLYGEPEKSVDFDGHDELMILYKCIAWYICNIDIVGDILENYGRHECDEKFEADDGIDVLVDFINYVAEKNGYDRVFNKRDLYEKYQRDTYARDMEELGSFLELTSGYSERLQNGEDINTIYSELTKKYNFEYDSKYDEYYYIIRESKIRKKIINGREKIECELYALAYAYAKMNPNYQTVSLPRIVKKKIQEMKMNNHANQIFLTDDNTIKGERFKEMTQEDFLRLLKNNKRNGVKVERIDKTTFEISIFDIVDLSFSVFYLKLSEEMMNNFDNGISTPFLEQLMQYTGVKPKIGFFGNLLFDCLSSLEKTKLFFRNYFTESTISTFVFLGTICGIHSIICFLGTLPIKMSFVAPAISSVIFSAPVIAYICNFCKTRIERRKGIAGNSSLPRRKEEQEIEEVKQVLFSFLSELNNVNEQSNISLEKEILLATEGGQFQNIEDQTDAILKRQAQISKNDIYSRHLEFLNSISEEISIKLAKLIEKIDDVVDEYFKGMLASKYADLVKKSFEFFSQHQNGLESEREFLEQLKAFKAEMVQGFEDINSQVSWVLAQQSNNSNADSTAASMFGGRQYTKVDNRDNYVG